MPKSCTENPIVLLLVLLLFFVSCSNKTQQHVPIEQPPLGTLTIIKTQGSNEYANVHSGLQDRNGNLWFATTGEGAYRYDGKHFYNFTSKDGLSNCIYSIKEDIKGNIWFGTDSGICLYNGSTFTHIPLSSSDKQPRTKNEVWSIMQDKAGTLWFAAADGLYCYNGISFTLFLDNEGLINEGGYHLKSIQSLLEDKAGNIWLGSGMGEGILRFDGKSITKLTTKRYGRIMSMIEDSVGNIWFGTGTGMCRYDGTEIINSTAKFGLDLWIYTILKDRRGNFWMASEKGMGPEYEEGGLWRFDGASFQRFTTKDGLPHNGVFCVVEDKSGYLWIGTRNTGLCRYDGKSFTTFSQ